MGIDIIFIGANSLSTVMLCISLSPEEDDKDFRREKAHEYYKCTHYNCRCNETILNLLPFLCCYVCRNKCHPDHKEGECREANALGFIEVCRILEAKGSQNCSSN